MAGSFFCGGGTSGSGETTPKAGAPGGLAMTGAASDGERWHERPKDGMSGKRCGGAEDERYTELQSAI